MIKKHFFAFALIVLPLCASYNNAEKILLIQDKLAFIATQKNIIARINKENKLMYKQAQQLAQYILQEDYPSIKKQIKTAMTNIIASQEFINYNYYSVNFKTGLIANHSIKAKHLPVVRPDQYFAAKINNILTATIPIQSLQKIEVINFFEAFLNFKVDAVGFRAMLIKLELVERELIAALKELELNNDQPLLYKIAETLYRESASETKSADQKGTDENPRDAKINE